MSLFQNLVNFLMSPFRSSTQRYQPAPVTAPSRRLCGLSGPADPLSIATLKKLGITRTRVTIVWNNYLDPRTFAADRSTVDPNG
jgi:hypothetical protein